MHDALTNACTSAPSFTADEMMAAMRKAQQSLAEIREQSQCTYTPAPSLLPSRNPLQAHVPVIPNKYMGSTKVRKRPCTNRRHLWRKWHATKTTFEPDQSVYMVGGVLVGHPDAIARMAAAIERVNEDAERVRSFYE